MQLRAAEPHPEMQNFLETLDEEIRPSYDQLSVNGARKLSGEL
jgi:hypothetical protein